MRGREECEAKGKQDEEEEEEGKDEESKDYRTGEERRRTNTTIHMKN